MIPTPALARMRPSTRLALAWAILFGVALLIALPIILAAANLAGNWQREAALHREVSALTQRVSIHLEAVSAWYDAHDETEDSVRKYSDPDQARQAFDADLDELSQALIVAGAHLRQAPSSTLITLNDTVTELVGEVGFSGALSDVLQSFATLEDTHIRLSNLRIEALPGQPTGRVRGSVELRLTYVTVLADDS
jgi:hypothetical protein